MCSFPASGWKLAQALGARSAREGVETARLRRCPAARPETAAKWGYAWGEPIQALFRAMESAAKKGDLDAAAALVDFPVMMMTDDSKGQAKGEAWDREKWTEVMRPFYEKPMKDVKVTHKPTVFLLSDSLASVDDVCTMTKGGKPTTSRNSMFVIRTDGRWRLKAMAEGGWGGVMGETPQATAHSAHEPSAGTGSAAERPGSQGTESGTSGAGSQGTGSGAQGETEKTTK